MAREFSQYRFSPRDFLKYPARHLLATVFFILSVLGPGRILLVAFWDANAFPIGLQIIFSFALGTALFSVYIFALGILGLLTELFLLLYLVPALLSGALVAFLFAVHIHPQAFESLSLVQQGLIGFLVWGLGNSFLQTFYPPTEIDSLTYHLALPKLWLKKKKMYFVPYIFQNCFPLYMAMFNNLAVKFNVDTLASSIHWLHGAALTALVFFWNPGHFDLNARLFAAACIACLPVISQSSTTPRNDVSWAFYAFLAMFIINRGAAGSLPLTLLAGLFAGFSAGSRFQGLLICFAIGVASWFSGKLNFYELLVFQGTAGLVCLPWYLRNFIWTGNPFWPLFYSAFDKTAPEDNFFAKHQAHFWRSPLDVKSWFKDFKLVWHPNFIQPAGQYFLFPLLALALFGPAFWREKDFVFLGWVGLFYIPVNLTLDEIWWRFQTGVIPAGCLLLGWLFSQGRTAPDGFFQILSWSAWIVFAPGLFERFRTFPTTLLGLRKKSDISSDARQVYLRENLNIYPVSEWINSQLPETSKILIFGNPQGYYLDRPYIDGSPKNQAILIFETMKDLNELREKLSALEITHILYFDDVGSVMSNTGLRLVEEKTMILMEGLLKECCLRLQTLNGFTVYELRSNGG